MAHFVKKLFCFLLFCRLFFAVTASAEPLPINQDWKYSLTIFSARMTDNTIDDFLDSTDEIDFVDSYLHGVALAKRIGRYRDLVSFEVEGQVVRHFEIQNHWEVNALLAARWELFPWDRWLDTSFAFGVGPSYATEIPEVEVQRSGDSARWQVYLLMELDFVLPSYPYISLVSRIHHRSNAFGAIADRGISNALAVGIKYRF